jgi:hypothetical protein
LTGHRWQAEGLLKGVSQSFWVWLFSHYSGMREN